MALTLHGKQSQWKAKPVWFIVVCSVELIRMIFDVILSLFELGPPRWRSGKAFAWGTRDAGIAPLFPLSNNISYFNDWYSSGYHARCLVLKGQCQDWLAQCQYTTTG